MFNVIEIIYTGKQQDFDEEYNTEYEITGTRRRDITIKTYRPYYTNACQIAATNNVYFRGILGEDKVLEMKAVAQGTFHTLEAARARCKKLGYTQKCGCGDVVSDTILEMYIKDDEELKREE
jgi:hypothetical protein